MALEKLLEIASRIANPWALAAFTVVFLGAAVYSAVKAKNNPIVWVLAIVIGLVAVTPITARTYLRSRGIYRVSLAVLNAGGQPITSGVEIRSAVGEKKTTDAGWEIDVPFQERPADGRIIIYAEDPDAFLSGSTTVMLNKDYYPSSVIQLEQEPPVMIHGEVIDEKQRGVSNADVILPDCSQSTRTDPQGLFEINSCAPNGMMLRVRVEKGGRSVSMTVIAGQPVELVLPKGR
ncbi:MAG: carboxypeptidase-like regulatory domain-containing protein [Terracidiphilus sp.]